MGELGARFDPEHLQVLIARCVDLERLDISNTSAADDLHAALFVGLPKLKTLVASMMVGVLSLMSSEALLGFQVQKLSVLHTSILLLID